MIEEKKITPYNKDITDTLLSSFEQVSNNEQTLLNETEGIKTSNLISEYTCDVFKSKLARKLKDERIKRGISQASLAEQSGVDRATIVKMESNKRKPTLDVIIRLSYAMGLTISISDSR